MKRISQSSWCLRKLVFSIVQKMIRHRNNENSLMQDLSLDLKFCTIRRTVVQTYQVTCRRVRRFLFVPNKNHNTAHQRINWTSYFHHNPIRQKTFIASSSNSLIKCTFFQLSGQLRSYPHLSSLHIVH